MYYYLLYGGSSVVNSLANLETELAASAIKDEQSKKYYNFLGIQTGKMKILLFCQHVDRTCSQATGTNLSILICDIEGEQ